MAERPWRLSARLLVACSVLTVIGFSAICANVMLDMRRGEVALARQSLDNLASSIDADVSRANFTGALLRQADFSGVSRRGVRGLDDII